MTSPHFTSRRQFLGETGGMVLGSIAGSIPASMPFVSVAADEPKRIQSADDLVKNPPKDPLIENVQLDRVRSGYDKKLCWVHPRAGAIPGKTPTVVMTMQELLLSGSDVFGPLNEMRTSDLGKTWTGPAPHKNFD